MPMYWGDYLRDTRDLTTTQHGAYLLLIGHYWQHEGLPTDERQLATITGLTLAKWRAIQEPIAAKFQDGWKHGRIDEELEQSERKINQRIIAGRKGGHRSGIARAQQRGREIREAIPKQSLALRSSGDEANGEAGSKQSRTNHKEEITTSEYDAAREGAFQLSESPSVIAMRERLAKRPT
jgi:uncharacterized protein YdaU (DUF1376 family)